MKELTKEEIQRLLGSVPAPLKQQSGESTPPSISEDSPDTFPCEYCGHCEDPEHCVFSIECPKCYAKPSELCVNPNGGLTGLHRERHSLANSPWWREYHVAA